MLSLRPNFAFWRIEGDCRKLSQADIFFIISALLENMRSGKLEEKDSDKPLDRLESDAYRQTVLSPACFGRYNDGVIQAALLRAAKPVELNYQEAPELSKLMAELIGQVVEERDKDHGEAAAEFVLALVLERLRLRKEDAKALCERLKNALGSSNDTDDPAAYLARHWIRLMEKQEGGPAQPQS